MELQEEKDFYTRFLFKYIRIVKLVNGREFFYKGQVRAIFSDKLILDDIRQGEIPISYDGLTIMQIKEFKEGEVRNGGS